ncbi:glycosyltransferase family 2 protein [Limosilactobacillus sp.]|uniref:glycosyltransferase family 2 protein n=1 Tax=Limosilactobacillus sp. TaxID=2773925 RepID=UPI003F045415
MVSNIMNEAFQTGSPWLTFVLVINLILCLYPILGAMFWFFGAISYMLFRHDEELAPNKELTKEPFVTIMIPAHNEEVVIRGTLEYLLNQLNYHNYEILVMDDGSTDQTPAILKEMQAHYPQLRVIRIAKNQGKAHAFNIGLFFAKGEYILSNDADTIPEKDALIKYMRYFTGPNGINYAAITANMDVYNRSTLWGKSQTVEFSSIVGIIKRSQTAVNNTMYAYSGANTMYRRDFLINVGGFRQDRATEDISIAWDHNFMNVTPKFAPDIVFHMNVPETFRDLYRQRKRWAQGGTEVWLSNFTKIIRHPWRHRFILSMLADTTLSIIWSFFFWITSIIFILLMIYFATTGNYERVWHGIAMSMIFVNFQLVAGLFQVLAALILDFNGAKLRYLMFSPIYLLFTWIVNPLTIVTTFLKAVKTVMGHGSGTWISPERKAHSND